MNTSLTIFDTANVGTLAETAQSAYRENAVSCQRCNDYGKTLLDKIAQSGGMNDALDAEAALYIEKAKKTVAKMNGKRSAVTQLFDNIRSAYTSLENEIDAKTQGTIPSQVQSLRNAYAAYKQERYEAEQREKLKKVQHDNALAAYRDAVEADIQSQLNSFIKINCEQIDIFANGRTLANIDEAEDSLNKITGEFPPAWIESTEPEAAADSCLTEDEAKDVVAAVKAQHAAGYAEQYTFEVLSCRDAAIARIPSKKEELQKLADASAEEAERIKQQMQEREEAEAKKRDQERAEREAKEKAAAELAAQKREMDNLFANATVQATSFKVNATVKQKIRVIHPEGFMQVVGMWWSQCGNQMSIEELEKVFSKQLTFCNKLANDKNNPMLIQSENIEYINEVKAK